MRIWRSFFSPPCCVLAAWELFSGFQNLEARLLISRNIQRDPPEKPEGGNRQSVKCVLGQMDGNHSCVMLIEVCCNTNVKVLVL